MSLILKIGAICLSIAFVYSCALHDWLTGINWFVMAAIYFHCGWFDEVAERLEPSEEMEGTCEMCGGAGYCEAEDGREGDCINCWGVGFIGSEGKP